MVGFKGRMGRESVGFCHLQLEGEEGKVAVKPLKMLFLLVPLISLRTTTQLTERWLWNLHKCM